MTYRRRIRPAYSKEELRKLYATPHNHTRWPDHRLRVQKTIELGLELLRDEIFPPSVADLSCGDAAIAQTLAVSGLYDLYLGDYASGYEFHGSIEETINEIPQVGLFVCCETLEHLDDPDAILRQIRLKADMLLLSTPNCPQDENPEHYWAWDAEEVKTMLMSAGWHPVLYDEVIPDEGYIYQIWGCI